MLQRAASNAYSWWRASHIRSKQSKWLDNNLEEMEDTVKKMVKLIEPDADSFGKRAELYFKRRPELIGFVEDAYRSYRALAERYDHISGELHKANHTISTCFPEQVQYAMLEDEDSIPKALTPINPSKINKKTVEGLINKKKEKKPPKKVRKKHAATPIDEETARGEINKIQKAILVLQTEKEFVKSSYESGIAKHWEIEKRIMEMQEEICHLQDEFNTSAVIEDDEARSLMTATVLKSCEDTIVSLQEQRKKSLEQEKKEYERTKIAKEKMKALNCENFETQLESTNLSERKMSLSPENIEEEYSSLLKARTELQSLSEKIKEHFEKSPESSVLEIAEKIEEFANKVITLELTVSSHTLQINQLSSENDELEKYVKSMEEGKSLPADGSNESSKKLKEVVEELRRVEAIESLIQNEDKNFRENLSETWDSLNGVSEMLLHPHKSLEYACIGDAPQEENVSFLDTETREDYEDKKATEVHDIKEDSVYASYTTQELGHLGDPTLTEVHEIKEESVYTIHTTRELGHLGDPSLIEVHEIKEDSIYTIHTTQELGHLGDPPLTEVHEIKEDSVYAICTTHELGHLGDPSLTDSSAHTQNAKELSTADPSIQVTRNEEIAPDGKEDYMKLQQLQGEEVILLTEYKLVLQNYEDTKRQLSEVEKKNEEYLQEMAALIEELKSDIAMKDEEIRLLRQPVALKKESSNGSLTPDTLTSEECSLGPQKPESISNSSMAKKNFSRQGPRRTKHLIVEKALAKRNSSIEFTKIQSSLAKGNGIQCVNDTEMSSPIEKKFRKEIDALLDERLEFWLRFSTSFYNIQAYKDKYEDLQTEIAKLKDQSQEYNDNVTSDRFGKPESTQITTRLRQLKTELQVWLEQGALLREDLQNRFSSLCNMQEEITSALNTTSEFGSALFTPCQAARFQGEVMNMKQDNNKVVSELQAGLDQVKGLQAEIERELSALIGDIGPLVPKSSTYDCVEYAPNRANVPLRDFLFGVKPKKPSVLSLIQQSKIKCGRRKID